MKREKELKLEPGMPDLSVSATCARFKDTGTASDWCDPAIVLHKSLSLPKLPNGGVVTDKGQSQSGSLQAGCFYLGLFVEILKCWITSIIFVVMFADLHQPIEGKQWWLDIR